MKTNWQRESDLMLRCGDVLANSVPVAAGPDIGHPAVDESQGIGKPVRSEITGQLIPINA